MNNDLKWGSVDLTPGQVQLLLELTPEMFRHWKKVLSPMKGRNGYRPCFTLGDLFALAVIKEATTRSGMRVRFLEGLAFDLFEIGRTHSWAALERFTICINPAAGSVGLLPETQAPDFDLICVLLRGRTLISGLRDKLLRESGASDQGTLSFLPTMVASSVRREGAA